MQRRDSFKGTYLAFEVFHFSLQFSPFSRLIYSQRNVSNEKRHRRRGGEKKNVKEIRSLPEEEKRKKCARKKNPSLTKENAREFFFLFSLFILLGRKLNENLSLGNSSLHIHTRRGAHRAAASRGGLEGIFWGRALLSMRDEAEDWRPIRKERRKKVFEKNGCSCPFYRPEIFTFETFAIFVRPGGALPFTASEHSPMNLSSTFSDT